MALGRVTRLSAATEISALLDSPEIVALIAELEALRWTGRKGYSIRALIGACLAKSLYAIPTWSRTAALIAEHATLRDALGDAPSVYALYRFATKLRDLATALHLNVELDVLRQPRPGEVRRANERLSTNHIELRVRDVRLRVELVLRVDATLNLAALERLDNRRHTVEERRLRLLRFDALA